MRRALLAALAALAPALPAIAAPDAGYVARPWTGKDRTFSNAGMIGPVRFYAGNGRQIGTLAFRRGNPPAAWSARGHFPGSADDVTRNTFFSLIMQTMHASVACTPASGKGLLPIGSQQADAQQGPLASASRFDFDGRDAAARKQLAALAPGKYRLLATFTLTFDEHVDGPEWAGATVRLAAGEVPLVISP